MFSVYSASPLKRMPPAEISKVVDNAQIYIQKEYEQLLAEKNLQEYSNHEIRENTSEEVRKRIHELESVAERVGLEKFKENILNKYGIQAHNMVDEIMRALDNKNESTRTCLYETGTFKDFVFKHSDFISPADIHPTVNKHLEVLRNEFVNSIVEKTGIPIEEVRQWLNDPNAGDLKHRISILEYATGVLCTKAPAHLAHENASILATIETALKGYFTAEELPIAIQGFKELCTTQATLESELAAEEAKLLQSLQKLGCKYYMITILHPNPSNYELSADKIKEIIQDMQAKGTNVVKIEITPLKCSNTI